MVFNYECSSPSRILSELFFAFLVLLFLPISSNAATLNGSAVAPPSVVNLTTEGTADWSHWGLSSASSFNHKAGVTSQIGNYTPLGAPPGRFGGNPSVTTTHSWTDGTPTASESGFAGGIFFVGVGNGYEISVPADTTVRTLRLYTQVYSSSSRVEATLSDGSAPAYSTVLSNANGVLVRVITLTFSAASAGQTLTVRGTVENEPNGPGTGNIALQAATLQQGNQPPIFNPPLGNQSVTEGNTLTFPVAASDPDGPAPLVLSISASSPPLPAEVSFVDNSDGTGSFSWTPGSADVNVYSVTFAATDDAGAGQTTEQTITVTVNAAGVGGGALNGSAVAPPSVVNLTTEGTADWSHWGLSSASSFNHKAGVTSQIGNYTPLGAPPGRFGGNPSVTTTHGWTDGTPTASESGFAGGIFFVGVGNGYEISVPADTTVRTLRLYTQVYSSSSRVEATLSDGSAPAYSTVLSNANGVLVRVITLTFSAASAGQTLTVRGTVENEPNGPGTGNIALQAATLQQGNQPPIFNPPLGNQSVTEGNTLTFPVAASDPDGPAPLVLSISASSPPLPAEVSFVDNSDGTGSFSWTPGSADVNVYSVTFAATDDAGAGQTTEQTITVTVNAAGVGGGALNGSAVAPPSVVNLTTEGTADWSHWGLSSASSFNHKAGVTSQIGNYTPLGAPPGRFGGNPSVTTTHSWTDGTPTASESGFAGGIFFVGVGNGYEISVPADTTVRTLRLYTGLQFEQPGGGHAQRRQCTGIFHGFEQRERGNCTGHHADLQCGLGGPDADGTGYGGE